jgi:hypothetical protein
LRAIAPLVATGRITRILAASDDRRSSVEPEKRRQRAIKPSALALFVWFGRLVYSAITMTAGRQSIVM